MSIRKWCRLGNMRTMRKNQEVLSIMRRILYMVDPGKVWIIVYSLISRRKWPNPKEPTLFFDSLIHIMYVITIFNTKNHHHLNILFRKTIFVGFFSYDMLPILSFSLFSMFTVWQSIEYCSFVNHQNHHIPTLIFWILGNESKLDLIPH